MRPYPFISYWSNSREGLSLSFLLNSEDNIAGEKYFLQNNSHSFVGRLLLANNINVRLNHHNVISP